MTVAEYARNTHREGEEITCVDSIYDTEWYAYVDDETMYDDFDYGCQMIWEHLDIVGIVDNDSGVVMVDMTSVIKEHMDELKEAELFKTYRVSDIVPSMNEIFSGYVSENWMMKFAKIITGRNDSMVDLKSMSEHDLMILKDDIRCEIERRESNKIKLGQLVTFKKPTDITRQYGLAAQEQYRDFSMKVITYNPSWKEFRETYVDPDRDKLEILDECIDMNEFLEHAKHNFDITKD